MVFCMFFLIHFFIMLPANYYIETIERCTFVREDIAQITPLIKLTSFIIIGVFYSTAKFRCQLSFCEQRTFRIFKDSRVAINYLDVELLVLKFEFLDLLITGRLRIKFWAWRYVQWWVRNNLQCCNLNRKM